MKEKLRTLFQQRFNPKDYRKTVLENLLHAQQLLNEPQFLEETNDGDRIYGLGYLTDADGKQIGLYYTDVDNSDVRRKRVGFRQMMKSYVKYGADAAIAVFADKEHWRLSYMSDLKGGETSAKRFSYILGDPNGQYNTPVNRLALLGTQAPRLRLKDIFEAFSVETLSKEFFDGYHRHYDTICGYLTKHVEEFSIFNSQLSILHDYVKKMMGRIIFLHFLQKKGWLNGNQYFLRDLYFMSPYQADFLEQVLEPLFFGIFNTETNQRERLFADEHWDKNLLAEWKNLPYLNGGLFERDTVDKLHIKLPGSLYEDLFTFLASYNFTVDENDPDDAEVGVDPEMLGKIFESLLEDNKAKGAFYTPKEIVRYMCKESLIAYLSSCVSKSPCPAGRNLANLINSSDSVGNDNRVSLTAEGGNNLQDSQDFASETSRSIRRFVEHHEMQPELEPYRDILDTALRNVKICDPAIGSGAFPMGLLNELWRCREALAQSNSQSEKKEISDNSFHSDCEKETSDCEMSRVELKKQIIENNIYGVDIERGAIDIARLRFWLSIVVDAEEPEPLPNFDYKFMQGNSLIESYKGIDLSRISNRLRGGQSKSTQLLLGLDSDFSKKNLQRLMRDYFSVTDHKQKASMRQAINDEVKHLITDFIGGSVSDLDKLDPSANQDFFLWHTWFKDIFDNGGFDIVIGNPPYIRRTELPEEAKKQYERVFKSAVLQYDIYLLFIEFGLSICNKDSQLCFINPIRFFNSDYGKGCRPIIIKNNYLWRVVDVSQIEVFKNAMTYPCVLHIQKQELKEYEIEYYTPQSLQVVNNVQDIDCKYLSKHNIINDQNCRIVVSEENGIIQKIDKISEPIETWFKVARGLPNNKVDFEGKNFKALKSTMVKKYRITESYKWVDTNYYAAFEGEMIILPRTVLYLQATLKEEGIVLLDRIYYLINKISVNTRFVLGIINAKVTNYWFEYFYSTTKVSGGYFDLNGTQIKSIPIPKATPLQQKQIADLVSDILQMKKEDCNANTASLEHEIDKIVYQLYNLTPEEIAIIEQ